MKETVKWGVLGTANIAKGCTIPGMKLAPNCELTAIAGRSIEKAKAFQKEFGFEKAYGSYEELINDKDVEAIYIPLPNNLHLQWVKAALKSGKHVLCEKPLALNEAEAVSYSSHSASFGCRSSYAHGIHRYHGSSRRTSYDEQLGSSYEYRVYVQEEHSC